MRSEKSPASSGYSWSEPKEVGVVQGRDRAGVVGHGGRTGIQVW